MCDRLALDLICYTFKGDSVPVCGFSSHGGFLRGVTIALRKDTRELLFLSREGCVIHIAIKSVTPIY